MKLATLIAAVTVAFASVSFGQGVVVFDSISNPLNGVPNASLGAFGTGTIDTFMGDAFQLTPGTTNITGFDLFLVNDGTGVTYSDLKITIYVWGSVNLGTVNSGTPAFGNLLATYTSSGIAGPFPSGSSVIAFQGVTTPAFVLGTPLAIPGTNIGITFNYQGSTDGINYVNTNGLEALIAYGTLPTVGGEDFDAFYLNLDSEVNGNFIQGPSSIGAPIGQTIAVRVFGTLATYQLPVANPQSITVPENGSANVTLTGSDFNSQPLSYSVDSSPTHGGLTGTAPNLVYTPNANYTGPDSFTFHVNDGTSNSTPATISLNVSSLLGLIIIPIYDTTILNDPNVVSITNTINKAILSYETRFSNPVTITIRFAEMGSGLGMSQTYVGTLPYSSYYPALVASSATTNDSIALAHLTGGSSNPVNGGANIQVTTALARALGFSANPPTNYDSIISVNMSLINITRPPGNPSDYDLQSVVSHEIDEVMGTSSGVGQSTITAADLYRYSNTAGVRNWTTSGDTAYFSIDGSTLLAQYNQNSGGDYGDWWSISAHSPVRVQDAFGTPNTDPDLGVELTVLDVVGWDLAGAVPLSVPATDMHASHSGSTINLSWNSVSGRNYQVQYTTNLVHTNWVNIGGPITASSGTTSTNDVSPPDRQRFYRVQVLNGPSMSVVTHASEPKAMNGPLSLHKHVLHPRNDSKSDTQKPATLNIAAPESLPIQPTPLAVQSP